ncbi:MAG TPA: hypothetical protein VN516_07355, partial [Candidatus Baltobacteraceae bacterium]|nr:hypothetical protein [Candidatus Baltobacteraceae bacterium]
QARSYGYSGELIDKREKYFQLLQNQADGKHKRELNLHLAIENAIFLGLAGISVGAIILIIKRILKRKRQ